MVRRSTRHGRGVFATRAIPKWALLLEYTGELITEAEGERRYPTPPDGIEVEEHTYLLTLDDTRVIDANVGGNAARFINHSCEPNCEPVRFGDALWIVAVRPIRVGEELAYDYAIELDEPHTPARKRRFPCRCGARRCRGSILKPKAQPLSAAARAAWTHFARTLGAPEDRQVPSTARRHG
ncbi:MAG: SET domain-containing protein-lysine N-methyltransferase [Gemmatimonadaceae bacterium]|nr:SET domain-containing protein-lysine N-methyltransferase [Gemmatimonadaceae bacterium]